MEFTAESPPAQQGQQSSIKVVPVTGGAAFSGIIMDLTIIRKQTWSSSLSKWNLLAIKIIIYGRERGLLNPSRKPNSQARTGTRFLSVCNLFDYY